MFVRVVEQGGFSAAARMSRMTPSAVSKLVTRMEARLGTRLVNRSTRALELTPEGCTFYERATSILTDIEDAERGAKAGELPVGRIRMNTSASYAVHILTPLLPSFLAHYPEISLEIVQTDRVVDILAERMDVAVRAGPMKSSSLIASKLGDSPMVIVGAPSYLARQSAPENLEDLEQHHRLSLGYIRASDGWPFRVNGAMVTVPTNSRVQSSDGEALRRLALAGVGLARLPVFTVRDAIDAGRLVPLLESMNPGDCEAFHAVYAGQGGPLPSRVRALLDFLGKHGRVN